MQRYIHAMHLEPWALHFLWHYVRLGLRVKVPSHDYNYIDHTSTPRENDPGPTATHRLIGVLKCSTTTTYLAGQTLTVFILSINAAWDIRNHVRASWKLTSQLFILDKIILWPMHCTAIFRQHIYFFSAWFNAPRIDGSLHLLCTPIDILQIEGWR